MTDPGDVVAPDPLIAARDAATSAIVNSPHPRRVVVAGPGTGKALAQRGGKGLALKRARRSRSADELGGQAIWADITGTTPQGPDSIRILTIWDTRRATLALGAAPGIDPGSDPSTPHP
ncbi:MAG: hypothetical protein WCK58_16545 [Chloroflexota bacterium]